MRFLASEGLTGYVVANRQPYLTSNALEDPRHTEQIIDLPYALAGIPLLAQSQWVGILWAGRKTEFTQMEARLITAIADMAANAIYRSSLYEETELRLQRLMALREIDKAITASHDVRETLTVLVDQVITQLSVHAADVLLFNSETQALEYAVGHGFRFSYLQSSRAIGHSLALPAVTDRRTIAITDVNEDPSVPGHRLTVHGEEFAAYFAVPLLAKDQVKGVLELFHRAPFNPNPEWLNFLETLAGQAAIAIDSAEMFANLQRSNLNLAVAYDRTIEAWAQALELRDHETEKTFPTRDRDDGESGPHRRHT
jgi:GAF domain-containing protein